MTTKEFISARAELGLTQVEMAKAIGKSRRQVQYYEEGKPIPPTVAKLLTILISLREKKPLSARICS